MNMSGRAWAAEDMSASIAAVPIARRIVRVMLVMVELLELGERI